MAKLKKRKNKVKVKKVKKIKPVKRRKFLVKEKLKKKNKVAKKSITKKKGIKRTIRKVKSKKKRVVKRAVSRKKVVKKKNIIKRSVKQKTKKRISTRVKREIVRPEPEFKPELLFKARIKVVGIGGGGGSIVSEIGKSLEKATFVIADTDIRALKKRAGIKYFWFGEELTHGLGTGVDTNLAKRAAESSAEKMEGIFKDQDIVIFIASLGGGLGSGATEVFAEVAKKFGGITLGIFTLPFKFEGANKYKIAQNALKSLRQVLNVSLVIPNEKIFKIIDENTPIVNAFSTVNKSLIESLESLIDLIYSPGIINIDFADLRTILKGVGNSAFLNTVEESGKDRAEKICKRIMLNPLLQANNFEVEKILFNIAGSDSLSMFEVEKISRYISELNPKSKIIFGISKNQKLKNKIKTTILMTGGGIIEKEVKELVVPEIVVEEISEKKIIKKAKKVSKKEKVGKVEEVVPIPKEENEISIVPISKIPAVSETLIEEKVVISQKPQESVKKTIRRSGLEIKKAEEKEEKKRLAQEKEWEIPAFLRRIKS